LAELAAAYARTAGRYGIPATIAIEVIDHALREQE
jgi:hypothetical protein